MSDARLTVLIANHNTAPFLGLSLWALDELTESPFVVYVHDDGSDPDDLEALAELERRHAAVQVFHRPSELRGSYAHGDAVDFMMSQVRTPYVALIDADCTPLMRGWDSYLIGRLDETTKLVGSRLGEGWSGNKAIDFPLPFLVMIETETYRELGISALPGEDTRLQDTCWQWRPKYLDAGYRGETLRSENMRLDPQPPFEGVTCAVYYTHDGALLGSHFGRGSNPVAKFRRGGGTAKMLARRLPGARAAAVHRWTRHRDRWLSVCRSVVEREATAAATR